MIGVIFAVMAGVVLTLQNSLNGLMSPHVGPMATSLVGFGVQVLVLLLVQAIGTRKLQPFWKVPLGYYSSGVMASVIVACNAFCVSRLGSAVSTGCYVAGQLIMSTVVDHFALFGMERHRFSPRHIPCFVLILSGVLMINLLGGTGANEAKLSYLMLSIAGGAGSVAVRSINSTVSVRYKSNLCGAMVNSLGGFVTSIVLFFALAGFKPDFTGFASVPAACYFAGALGVACLLCTIMAYRGSNVFYATVFMLIGQVVFGIIMDLCVFHALSAGKCVGVGMVAFGVVLDKWLTQKQ